MFTSTNNAWKLKTNTVGVGEPLASIFLSNVKSFKDYLIYVTAKKFK